MGNKTSSKKIAYQTKRQKEYLLAYTKTDLFETQRKREKDALERLQLPEASWTLPELQASGKKFTYEFNGRTEEKSLDNSFLVGYGALHNFISCYSSLAVLAQCMEGDIVKCKEYLYLAAYCQRCICQWPNQEKVQLKAVAQLCSLHLCDCNWGRRCSK